jgi:Tol biopolymer transport system component
MRIRPVQRLASWIATLVVIPAAIGAETPEIVALRSEVRALGWLIFSARSDAGDWDLFAMRPDGSDRRNLTQTPQKSEFLPRLTRDGTRLLFRRVPLGEVIDGNRHGEQGEPVMSLPDGREAKSLGPAGALPWASWSPDGLRLLCLAAKGFSIVEVASGAVVRAVRRQGFFQQPTWSPDGESVLGVSNGFGTGWSVAKLDLATEQVVALNREDCCTPDWSADGRSVIFSWRVPGQKANGGQGWTQLWTGDARGAKRALLVAEDGRHLYGGCFSPDGRYALFTGNAAEDGDPKHAGAPMQILRLADAPIVRGACPETRALHATANAGPVLDLPSGWEPCWTSKDLSAATP